MKLVSLFLSASLVVFSGASTANTQNPQGAAEFASGTAGVPPMLNVINDLGVKSGVDSNSIWAAGDTVVGGHKLSYVYNVLILGGAFGGALLQNLAVADSTTGVHHSDSTLYPLPASLGTATTLNIVTPKGSITGDFDDLRVVANFQGGAFDLHMKAAGPALFNGGTGVFPLGGMPANEYSIPRLATAGTIQIDGVTSTFHGNSWFDRQWGNQNANLATSASWMWIRMNLSTGDALSVWSATDPVLGKKRAWATILHADGSQSVTAVEPSLGATNFYISNNSGARFAGAWTVRIPQFNAVLHVTPQPVQQEFGDGSSLGAMYEAASSVVGVYKGIPVIGTGTAEQLGSQ